MIHYIFSLEFSQLKAAQVLLLSILFSSHAVFAQPPVRIMPIGDSITEAEGGFASYRYWLWRDLASAGYSVDFVGSQSGVYSGSPRFSNFDQDHEGHWGWRADEVLENLGAWARQANPDLALIHLGTNDVWQQQPIAGTAEELKQVVQTLRSVNPNVGIALSMLIPGTRSALDRIPDLNQEISRLARRLDRASSPVILVDQTQGFDATRHTYDGVHPNEAGEQRMALKYLAAIEQLIAPSGEPTPCKPSATTVCLNESRFAVSIDWQTSSGSGQAPMLRLSSDTAYATFFDEANVEVVLKVLDGCAVNGRFWVFAAGLTDVATTIRVTDSQTNSQQVYETRLGQAFAPLQDVDAFASCP